LLDSAAQLTASRRKYRENQALPLDSPQVAKLQRSVLDMTVMLTSNLDHEVRGAACL
jgi:hypothetical protein